MEVVLQARVSDEDDVAPVRVVDPEFVEQVKADAAAAPVTEDTVPEETGSTEEGEN